MFNVKKIMKVMQIESMHRGDREGGLFEWYRVRAARNANHKVKRVGQSSKTNTL